MVRKRPSETVHRGFEIEAEDAPAREEGTGMTVLNGERVAQLPIAGQVRSVRGSDRFSTRLGRMLGFKRVAFLALRCPVLHFHL